MNNFVVQYNYSVLPYNFIPIKK
ncbi:hypothetical protein PQZ60_gp76 [Klebsiella phage vB_KpnM_FZ14]|nr:hypothetical protein PQZ60_gp75 [Klebsiella phage vB_KpnM_FZ14]YP_010684821.1 hypothetical protein PQZ60_gp76 [Klebsiella phage vB_KpnM_FZ14]